jgi:UDP-N-acetylglucosamine 1-carboxyvinyltransferase
MSTLIIEGGVPLRGELTAAGNKNAVLPMLAAVLLTEDEVTIENVPAIRDVDAMLEILDHLGVAIARAGSQVRLRAASLRTPTIPPQLCSRLRTSFLCVGPLLARLGRAKVSPPGGDVIGHRRLDAHVYGLRKLGVVIDEANFEFGIERRLSGADLFFDEASVTATEHLLLAAATAEGRTLIRNAASEPHVQALAEMLNAMGAQISGIGTNRLVVEGVERLHGATCRVPSDHIEVGSFLALVAATGGEVTIHDTIRTHYWMINRVFERFNLRLDFSATSVTLPGGQEPRIAKDLGGQIPRVDDGPWPQFPSDLMSSMLVLATQSEGTVLFFEKMFESRLYFVDPLMQMGASIIVCDPHRVVITGKTPLRGQPVRTPDIRAGMALVSAALCARGTATVGNAEIIDRGYENLAPRLQQLGARISVAP